MRDLGRRAGGGGASRGGRGAGPARTGACAGLQGTLPPGARQRDGSSLEGRGGRAAGPDVTGRSAPPRRGCSSRASEQAPPPPGLGTQRARPWPQAPRVSGRGAPGAGAVGGQPRAPAPSAGLTRRPPRLVPQRRTRDRGCCAPSRRRWVSGAGGKALGEGAAATPPPGKGL